MTLLLTASDVEGLVDHTLALDAMRTCFRAEAEGKTELPIRLDAPSPEGFIRTMPAVLDDVMGLKVMTLVRDLGTRYLVLLYSVESGECLALLDADEVTRSRTAATTGLAALHMVPEPPRTIGMLGTGFEAKGHLAVFAGMWDLDTVYVHSRSEHNRRRFAEEMSQRFGVKVEPTDTPAQTLGASDTIVLATKSTAPVLDGRDLLPGSVVLSIGSTRPDLREFDVTTVERARHLVVDAEEQVLEDSGDLIAARDAGALDGVDVTTLAALCDEGRVLSRPEQGEARDLSVFKSAGTALQDLALAKALYDRAVDRGAGTDIGEISQLKPFT